MSNSLAHARNVIFGPPPPSPMFRVTGRTEAGQPVWGGVFYLHDTHGVPVAVTLEQIQRIGGVPDVLEFVGAAWRAGCSYSKIVSMISENWGEVYGRAHADEVICRVNAVLALAAKQDETRHA